MSLQPKQAKQKPVKVVITGAAGQIGYALIPLVAKGEMLGPEQPVHLMLLDVPQAMEALKGVQMEIDDGAYPLLTSHSSTADLKEAFTDADFCLFVGGFPRLPGMERKDLLQKNAEIFVAQGKALNDYAKQTCKSCVVANPCNTNCMILIDNCPNIPAQNFSSMLMLDHNRMCGQIKNKLSLASVDEITNIHVWGNHSTTMVPDLSNGVVGGSVNLSKCLDAEWVRNEFTPCIQNRGAAVLKARQKSSAMSAANACVDHVRLWMQGTREGDWVSMGVPSDGSYGISSGIVFGFPVVCKNGEYSIVPGLERAEDLQKMMKSTEAELLEEKKTYLSMKQ